MNGEGGWEGGGEGKGGRGRGEGEGREGRGRGKAGGKGSERQGRGWGGGQSHGGPKILHTLHVSHKNLYASLMWCYGLALALVT